MSEDDFFVTKEDLEEDEHTENNRPSLVTILISVLILLALLATLIFPLLRSNSWQVPRPTPTPSFLREAQKFEENILARITKLKAGEGPVDKEALEKSRDKG